MQMLKKMFKSDSKYYLELDSEQEKAIDAATKASNGSSAKVKSVAKSKPIPEAAPKAAPAKTKAKDDVVDAAPVAKATKNSKKSKGKKSKVAKKTSKVAKTKEQQAPTVKKVAAPSYEPPFWVAAMYSNNGNASNGSSNGSTGQTFATDNLMPTVTKSRRRPGPSLDKFKEMAKKAGTRRR